MPSAFNPASTSAAEARRSLAMTGAPKSFSTPVNHRGRAFDLHLRAHAFQFREMHVALRKNIFRDDADAFGGGKQRAHLRLHVGRKTGIRFGRDLERLSTRRSAKR